MEDTLKIELLTSLTGTFLPNKMEEDWEGEKYHELEEEQVLFDGADLIPYVSEIQEKIVQPYNTPSASFTDGTADNTFSLMAALPSK